MLKIRPLPKELAKIAREELNEISDRVSNDIEAIREWLTMQPHLNSDVDDQFLITFLRGCKFSLERTKEKFDKYCSIKTAMPDLLIDRDPSNADILEIIRLGVFLPLPITDKPNGPKVMMVRAFAYSPSKHDMGHILKVYTMMADILCRDDDDFNINGQVIFIDLTNIGWSHLLQFNLSYVKKVFTMIQDGMSTRFKGLHYYRPPAGFETMLNLIKSVLSEKNKKRLHVHGDNIKGLYKFIPKKVLPAEYGGESGPIQDIVDDWEKKLLANKDYFKKMEKYASDESRRLIIEEVSGSFRKLDVD